MLTRIDLSASARHHMTLCAVYKRYGARFSRQRSFVLCCDMYLRFRGCTVVFERKLSLNTWYQTTRCVLLRAGRLLLALLLLLTAASCRVRHKFQIYKKRSETKIRILGQSEHQKQNYFSRPTTGKLPEIQLHTKCTCLKCIFQALETPHGHPKAAGARK